MNIAKWQNLLFCALCVGVLVFSQQNTGQASSDIKKLVDTLVQKNLISYSDAQDIVKSSESASDIPAWVKSIKLKGDFRARYQYQKQKGSPSRERGRIRYRLGIIANPNDDFEVGFGLASGSSDPRSTNVTLDSSFESKDVKLDYAYAKYIGSEVGSLWVGKYNGINSALWLATDFLWDGDITPEGIGFHISKDPADNIDLFMNAGYLIIEEQSSKGDPNMVYIQPGISFKASDNMKAKLAIAYYMTNSLKGKSLAHSANTNTLEGGVLKYDYDAVNPSFEISMSDLLEVVPHIAVFADYVKASDPDKDNEGYAAGIKFGSKKIKEFGDWQLKYMYRKLEKDAFPDTFPDSDALSGKTGVKGHKASLKLGLMEHVSFGLNYYDMEEINSPTKERLLQADVVWKF